MTQTAHTPGPWHICEATKRDLKLVRDDNGFCVAQAIEPGNSRAAYINAEANLQLIAAAPELLVALEAMHACHRAFSSSENWTSLDDEARLLAEKVIAKAKGK